MAMSICGREISLVVFFIALCSLIAPFQLIDFIALDGYLIRDNGVAYVSSQPWWIGLPAIFAWIATLIWILFEFPVGQSNDQLPSPHGPDRRANSLEASTSD